MSDLLSFPPREKPPRPEPAPPGYVELVSTSNFSFLRGGSHPEELVAAAGALGLAGFGLCDRNTFAGVVRAFVALRDLDTPHRADFRYLVGTRLSFSDGTPDLVAYPTDREAFGRLCKLLTIGNARGDKGAADLRFADLFDGEEDFLLGQQLIFIADEIDWDASEAALARLAAQAHGRIWVAGHCTFLGADRARLARLADLGRRHGAPLIATNNVLYHAPERRPLQDAVTCIREHFTIYEAGRRLEQNAERHLKTPAEMARLFREHPQALAETTRFAARISFALTDLQYNYPEETVGNGESAQETLERLTWAGAATRYPRGIPETVKASLWSELSLIAYKHYAPYFLTVHDLVRFARHERQILCQGRGSAANSAVCFCLEITEVDPSIANLVFGRFLSTERDEPPDIDVDFEHERREEVMQYLYEKYGRHRTGLTANVITYRTKSAVREVAKVFGVSDDTIAALNNLTWGWGSEAGPQHIRSIGLDPDEPVLKTVLALAGELRGFPRHLSQHVGGFVITRDPLDRLVPIGKSAMESRTIVEWNKDDIDALGILKVDVLALGMLTCIRRAFELMHVHYGQDLTLAGILEEERDDQKLPEEQRRSMRVYRMTHRADTIGVFQIESRAQMSMLPRLRPKVFYDLVIEVAIVRPGPIQGGMVHPYLKRRLGNEKPVYPSKALEGVLGRTLGIPLFQEQAMQIAVVGAGFSPGEADQLRRAMATWRRNGRIDLFRQRFITGMAKNGYDRDFAERCFKQIEGFGEYGFPESHAASFALLVYVSCWLKCHYPDVFACALLNSQPMGFYAPAQIVRDATEHGVEVRPVDVNLSDLWSILEDGPPAAEHIWERHAEMRDDIRSTRAIRLGFLQMSGFKEDHAHLVMARRGRGYESVRDVWLRTGLPVSALEKLAEADAFGSLGLSRRDALWAVKGLMGTAGAERLPLFATATAPISPLAGENGFSRPWQGQAAENPRGGPSGTDEPGDDDSGKSEALLHLAPSGRGRREAPGEGALRSSPREAGEGDHPKGGGGGGLFPDDLDRLTPTLDPSPLGESNPETPLEAPIPLPDGERSIAQQSGEGAFAPTTAPISPLAGENGFSRLWQSQVAENPRGGPSGTDEPGDDDSGKSEALLHLSLGGEVGGRSPPGEETLPEQLEAKARPSHSVPSPLEGEGARRAGEGYFVDSEHPSSGAPERRSALKTRADSPAHHLLPQGEKEDGGLGHAAFPLEPAPDLPPMPPGEEVVHDYRTISLSLKGHPVGFLRPELDARGILRCADLMKMPHGRIVTAAGLVLVRQRPGTASGVIFSTLEDETGIANIIIWSKVFEANRRVVLGSRLMAVRGQLQREGLVTHIVAREFIDFTPALIALADGSERDQEKLHDFSGSIARPLKNPIGDKALSRADEGRTGPHAAGRDEAEKRRQEVAGKQARAALPVGRNFR